MCGRIFKRKREASSCPTVTTIMIMLFLTCLLALTSCVLAFSPAASSSSFHGVVASCSSDYYSTSNDARECSTHRRLRMSSDDDDSSSSTGPAHERIQSLVSSNPVLLFMKGTKLFPQCGFSNTACQILQSYNIDFTTVDVLADDEVRQGVKAYSEWPTIPQLYVCGEFIGGSDIMIEMYQSGELGEMIEKAKAEAM